MKWIRDQENDFVNLDRMETIVMGPAADEPTTATEATPEEPQYEVVAIAPQGDSYILCSGSSARCTSYMASLGETIGCLRA